jgi:biotin carboxyl carrier protein
MATYKVKSQGSEHVVTVVDNATGGATVTIEGCDESFQVEFLGGTGAEIAAAGAAASGPQTIAAATPAALPAAPAPTASPRASAAPIATSPTAAAPPVAGGAGAVVAPIPGKILSIEVAVGDAVELNQLLLKLEAMKMENNVAAPIAGTVQSIEVAAGAEVRDGQLLVVIA